MNRINPETDGRLRRGAETRQLIVGTCRALIAEGDVRPTTARIAKRSGYAMRSIHHHFQTLSALFREALQDPAVSNSIVERVMGDQAGTLSVVGRDRLIHALLFDEPAVKS